jgi:hypothetical protein
MSMVPVDRTGSGTKLLPEDSVTDPHSEAFSDTFPLHMKSVMKKSGPELAFVLPLVSVEGIIARWLRQFPKVRLNRFQKELPFDCVLRAIRAHPNSLQRAEWLIHESLKTKGRFKFFSIAKLREKLEHVVNHFLLGDEVRNALESRMSITYCHLIVFNQIDRQESRALAKGGKWITMGRLKPYLTTTAQVSTAPDLMDI